MLINWIIGGLIISATLLIVVRAVIKHIKGKGGCSCSGCGVTDCGYSCKHNQG